MAILAAGRAAHMPPGGNLMVQDHIITRRSLLRLGTVVGAAVGAGGLATGRAGAAERDTAGEAHRRDVERRVKMGRTSLNGWPIEKGADIGGGIWTRPVPGTEFSLALHAGPPTVLLTHVVRRFHYEIDWLNPVDVTSFRSMDRAARGHETNHGSGTALDIRPGWFPAQAGKR